MNTFVFNEKGLMGYASTFGLPHELSLPFIRKVLEWSKESGDEWTTTRLKAIKLDLLRLKAGHKICSDHISYRGWLKGILTFCFRNRRNFSKCIHLLQVYTTLYSPELTPNQERKFLDGVMTGHVEVSSSYHKLLQMAVSRIGIKRSWIGNPKPYAIMPTSENRRCPLPDGHSYVESDHHLDGLLFLTSTKTGNDLLTSYPELFDSLLEGIDKDKVIMDGPIFLDSIGRIGLIQEPGYKLRAVANPGRIYQRLLQPLGDLIYDTLKVLPWDCTHNQSKPFSVISNHLQSSKTVYSVDLTGATDYFPLDIQLTVLRSITFRKEYIDIFHKLSRGKWWYIGTDGQRKLIQWNQGQPLGLYPSFGSFALTHGLLLYALNNFEHRDMFFVLGDDVIILDEKLYSKYISFLEEHNCPFSPMKSIVSDQIAEFAGKLITSNEVIEQVKWRSVSDDNFIDIVRNLGPKAISLLKPRQRKVALALWEVPDFLGGIGFNPKGIPLSTRYFKYLEDLKETGKGYLMSYNREIQRLNYCLDGLKNSFTPVTHRVTKSEDFDQKSYSFVLQYLPSLIAWKDIVGTNLFTVNDNLSLMIAGNVGRKTRLEQLERR